MKLARSLPYAAAACFLTIVLQTTSVGQSGTYPFPDPNWPYSQFSPTVPTTVTQTITSGGPQQSCQNGTQTTTSNTSENVYPPLWYARAYPPYNSYEDISFPFSVAPAGNPLIVTNGNSQGQGTVTQTLTQGTYPAMWETGVGAQGTYTITVSGHVVTEQYVINAQAYYTLGFQSLNQNQTYTITSSYDVVAELQTYSFSFNATQLQTDTLEDSPTPGPPYCVANTVVSETGSVVVNYINNTESGTLSFTSNNLNPTPSIVSDKLKGVPQQPTTITLTATLTGLPDQKVDFSAQVVDVQSSAGHIEANGLHDPTTVLVGQFNPPGKPPYQLSAAPSTSCNTTGGTCQVTLLVSEVSGIYSVTASLDSNSAISSSLQFTVAVPALNVLPSGTTYVPDGSWGQGKVTSQHSANHNGTSTLITNIQTVATMYFQQSQKPSGQSLGINDMSLPLGGLFDLTNTFVVVCGAKNDGHCSHRIGSSVDIDHATYVGTKQGPQKVNQKTLKDLMTANGMYNIPEGKSIHYQVNGTPKEIMQLQREFPSKVRVAPVTGTHVVAKVVRPAGGLLTYSYSVTNDFASAADIADIRLDLSTLPGADQLSANGVVQGSGSLVDYQTAVLTRATSVPTIPVGLSSPAGWLGMVGVDGFAKWTSETELESMKPGESARTFQILSPGLPGIREFDANPYIKNDSLGLDLPANDLDALRYEAQLRSVEEAAAFKGLTVGPVAPPADFKAVKFLHNIEQYKQSADQLGWIHDPKLSNLLEQALETVELALVKNDAIGAKASTQRFLTLLDGSSPDALSPEADALLRFNVEYLMTGLN
jgi:hypothetical protein